jgi:hypothetical protein
MSIFYLILVKQCKSSTRIKSNKKCGLSHLFFEIEAAKVGFPSQNHTFFVDKMCFSKTLRPKILKNKGPDVNFLFDFSKTM